MKIYNQLFVKDWNVQVYITNLRKSAMCLAFLLPRADFFLTPPHPFFYMSKSFSVTIIKSIKY